MIKLQFGAIVALGLLAVYNEANKVYRFSDDDVDAEAAEFYRRLDEDSETMEKRQLRQNVSCGRAPTPAPANTIMTSTPKQQYAVGDVITYRCAPAYMRLVENSLSVTCQSNGQWSRLPICQSYTFSCRRTRSAREYKGRVNQTRCGSPCQAWTADTPVRPAQEVKNGYTNPQLFPEYKNAFDAQNYCRSPDPNDPLGPWCYLANYDGSRSAPRYGYCDITYCDGFDQFDEYDRIPGACGCQGEWYNAIRNFGNIKTMEDATLSSCKEECDASNQCQGMVFDEQQGKCWLKKCSCTNQEVACNNLKHETYYRKKQAPCPGVERFDRYGQRVCYYSLFNFNLNSSLVFDWQTSRRLCQNLFPIVSDIAALESDDEWDFLARNVAALRIPLSYNRLWLGLYRPENVSDSWTWVNQRPTWNGFQPPLNYSRWAPGEPTNGYEEQCVQVILAAGRGEDRTAVGRWADESCRFKAPVVCEAKMPNWSQSKREDVADKREFVIEEEIKRELGAYEPLCKSADCEK